jgi:predicted metal-dependent peptidase
MENKELENALSKAKCGLMSTGNAVFITSVIFNLKQSWTDKVQTASVTHKDLYINPDYFMSLEPKQRVGLMAHEPWHLAFMHLIRGVGKNHNKYNRAADYVINNMLLAAGYELPPNGLWDKQYDGMSTEQVYDLLPDLPEDDDYDLDFEIGGGDGEDTLEDVKSDIVDILIKAKLESITKGDKPGTIPGFIEVELDKLLYPKLPWNRILGNYLTNVFGRADFTYRKPNRRYFPEYFMPSVESTSLCHIACFADTSCSMSDHECLVYISELNGIKQQFKPEKMTVVDFDTSLKKIRVLGEFDTVADIKFSGRGGTDIAPVMKWIKKNEPKVAIIFTDGGFNHYEPKGLNTDIIWIIGNNENWTSNLGKVIHYDP